MKSREKKSQWPIESPEKQKQLQIGPETPFFIKISIFNVVESSKLGKRLFNSEQLLEQFAIIYMNPKK